MTVGDDESVDFNLLEPAVAKFPEWFGGDGWFVKMVLPEGLDLTGRNIVRVIAHVEQD